jgi:branched-chain amino acid transport system substrate-binding protein
LLTKRTMRALSVVAVLVVLGAACSKKTESGGGTTSGATKKAVSIAYMGALTGDYAQLVIPGYQAAQLAADEANQGKFGDLPVTIQVVGEDTQGSPAQAPWVADKVVNDPSFVGVIGPTFSGESQAAGGKLDAAGLPFITPSATNPGLAENGWTHWFRAVGNDNSQGPGAAQYIVQKLTPNCVVDASDDSTYGEGLADIVDQTLKGAGIKVSSQKGAVHTGQKEFSALVTKIKSSGCTAIFYGGYSPEAAPLRTQLTQAGVKAVMVGGDGIKDDAFLQGAGASGDQTVASCPCADITSTPASASPTAASTSSGGPATDAQAFISDYTAKYGSPPGIYSAEGWDVMQMYIAAFKAGKTTPSAITDFVRGLNGFAGLTKSYTFQPSGELDPSSVTIYFYQDVSAQWSYLGRSDQLLQGT